MALHSCQEEKEGGMHSVRMAGSPWTTKRKDVGFVWVMT